MWWNLASLSVAGDICELAAACCDEVSSWSEFVVNCPFQDRYQGYLKHRKNYCYYFLTSVSRFSINFSEGFGPHLDI